MRSLSASRSAGSCGSTVAGRCAAADLAISIVAHIVLGVGLLIAARAAYHALKPRCCQCGTQHNPGRIGHTTHKER